MDYEETWKDVDGYEGFYQISNKGNVRSVDHTVRKNRSGETRISVGRVLRLYKMPNGYMQVQFSKNGKKQKHYVHRLVASAFIHNLYNLPEVNHIDGDKENNFVDNLEWISRKDNQIHLVKSRLTRRARPVMCVETEKQYNSMMEAARETGAERHNISNSCKTGSLCSGVHWRWVYG